MSSFRYAPRFIAAVIGLTAGLVTLPAAWSQVAPGTIGDHDSVFIDGQSFKITPGKAKPDAANRINDLGGREVGAGALIYRRGDKLFLLGAPLVLERPAGPAVETKPDTKKEQLGRIKVQYDPPKNPDHQKIYELLKGIKALETVQQMLSPARLPVTLVIKTMECDGMINSWYNTDDSVPTVHMCYELMQNIIKTTPMESIHADITRRDAIIGQALFWTLHEVGHAAFDVYKVPLFGREEDAADQFSGYLMLHFGKDQARRWIEGAAYAAEEFMKDFAAGNKYWSIHGLPQQRFFNLLCLAYGADHVMFADVTTELEEIGFLPKRRAGNCEYEFQSFDYAFKTQISPHLDRELVKKVMDTTWFPEPPPQGGH